MSTEWWLIIVPAVLVAWFCFSAVNLGMIAGVFGDDTAEEFAIVAVVPGPVSTIVLLVVFLLVRIYRASKATTRKAVVRFSPMTSVKVRIAACNNGGGGMMCQGREGHSGRHWHVPEGTRTVYKWELPYVNATVTIPEPIEVEGSVTP